MLAQALGKWTHSFLAFLWLLEPNEPPSSKRSVTANAKSKLATVAEVQKNSHACTHENIRP